MKGTFGEDFTWEAAANKNIVNQQYRNEGVVDTATRGVVTANGSINYFAREQAAGAVAASGLFGTALGTAQSTLTTYDARLTGKLFDLPGGELGFAAGVEYRTETLNQTADRNSQSATFGWDSGTTLDPFNSGRDVKSVFAEVRVPLFGGDNKMSGANLLEVTAAGRKENTATRTTPSCRSSPSAGSRLTTSLPFAAPTPSRSPPPRCSTSSARRRRLHQRAQPDALRWRPEHHGSGQFPFRLQPEPERGPL